MTFIINFSISNENIFKTYESFKVGITDENQIVNSMMLIKSFREVLGKNIFSIFIVQLEKDQEIFLFHFTKSGKRSPILKTKSHMKIKDYVNAIKKFKKCDLKTLVNNIPEDQKHKNKDEDNNNEIINEENLFTVYSNYGYVITNHDLDHMAYLINHPNLCNDFVNFDLEFYIKSYFNYRISITSAEIEKSVQESCIKKLEEQYHMPKNFITKNKISLKVLEILFGSEIFFNNYAENIKKQQYVRSKFEYFEKNKYIYNKLTKKQITIEKKKPDGSITLYEDNKIPQDLYNYCKNLPLEKWKNWGKDLVRVISQKYENPILTIYKVYILDIKNTTESQVINIINSIPGSKAQILSEELKNIYQNNASVQLRKIRHDSQNAEDINILDAIKYSGNIYVTQYEENVLVFLLDKVYKKNFRIPKLANNKNSIRQLMKMLNKYIYL
jgi:hypothetical protein